MFWAEGPWLWCVLCPDGSFHPGAGGGHSRGLLCPRPLLAQSQIRGHWGHRSTEQL